MKSLVFIFPFSPSAKLWMQVVHWWVSLKKNFHSVHLASINHSKLMISIIFILLVDSTLIYEYRAWAVHAPAMQRLIEKLFSVPEHGAQCTRPVFDFLLTFRMLNGCCHQKCITQLLRHDSMKTFESTRALWHFSSSRERMLNGFKPNKSHCKH